MQPTLVTRDIIDAYLAAGHWSRDTMVDRYRVYAKEHPGGIACRDNRETFTWAELDATSDRLAATLIGLGVERDATALVQTPSTCREIVLRVALKKAGIIGVFAPLQWRRRELDYVRDRIGPGLVAMSRAHCDKDTLDWIDGLNGDWRCLDLGDDPPEGWIGLADAIRHAPDDDARDRIAERQFRFDEISLITASSGTSGLAKLCEWPEGAQVCQSRVLRDRMKITADDKVGIFAPTAGAAGLMMWMISWTVPCACYFPESYRAAALLDLVAEAGITAGTTVPVILVRLAEEDLDSRDLGSLRLMRIGTAAADMSAAISFEERSGCRVVVASGSMECTGFGHAHVDEPAALRLNGSVGLPLEGCRLRIVDERGADVPAGTSGELKVTAPFSSSGYWKDPETTASVWSEGWYATGDVGVLDVEGRLTLLGRLKDTINRSGHKILPAEVEAEIARLPDVIECSVVAAPDREYGQVPWAFVQMRPESPFDPEQIADALENSGLARYKIPTSIVEVTEFPRINDSKIDKKALLKLHQPGGGT